MCSLLIRISFNCSSIQWRMFRELWFVWSINVMNVSKLYCWFVRGEWQTDLRIKIRIQIEVVSGVSADAQLFPLSSPRKCFLHRHWQWVYHLTRNGSTAYGMMSAFQRNALIFTKMCVRDEFFWMNLIDKVETLLSLYFLFGLFDYIPNSLYFVIENSFIKKMSQKIFPFDSFLFLVNIKFLLLLLFSFFDIFSWVFLSVFLCVISFIINKYKSMRSK